MGISFFGNPQVAWGFYVVALKALSKRVELAQVYLLATMKKSFFEFIADEKGLKKPMRFYDTVKFRGNSSKMED